MLKDNRDAGFIRAYCMWMANGASRHLLADSLKYYWLDDLLDLQGGVSVNCSRFRTNQTIPETERLLEAFNYSRR